METKKENTKTTVTLDIVTWRKLTSLRMNPKDTIESVINDLLDHRAGEKYTASKSALNEVMNNE